MPSVLTPRLVDIARAAAAAGHGGKEAVYQAACKELNMSRATLLRKIKEVSIGNERKQRSDAGKVSLTKQEAELISAVLMESLRKNNKRIMSIGQAVHMLRANGEVKAEHTDAGTGEVKPLSDNAISRALRTYGLHPDQLQQPAPAVEMRSLHPNHVWQIDASLCVLYYLKREGSESGLQVMDHRKFYKNKPANLKKIESDRVWRYAVTDHYSGTIFVHYVLGAESGANLAESFIAAIQKRAHDQDPFHGVPFKLMMDPGSANTNGLFKNLLRRLNVEPLVHAPEQPRGTGQVENAHNLIETNFESGLRFKAIGCLEELNEDAGVWMRWFNGTKKHGRHGHTRYAMWQTIREDQLRIAPPIDLCRELLTHEPQRRKVNVKLRVEFAGREWDVSGVPNIMVGEPVMVTYNPYNAATVYIVDRDAAGEEVLHPAPLVERDEAGFSLDARIIGEEYRAPADTRADTARKEQEKLVTGAETLGAAAEARKAKAVPFNGRIDPFKHMPEETVAGYLPRKGTELPASTRVHAVDRVVPLFEAAGEMVRRGVEMTVERNAQIRAWYPDGVPESELDQLQQRLTVRASLRVVGGE